MPCYLTELPSDALKIDRWFVVDMTASLHGLSLVVTIINLAHSLKPNIVVDGVEIVEQLCLLRLPGCDEMHYCLFCKPVSSEIFETLLLSPDTVRSFSKEKRPERPVTSSEP